MTGAAEIYIEGSPAERRAGHLDANGLALGLDIERVTRPRLIGAIFLARVKAVDKRLGTPQQYGKPAVRWGTANACRRSGADDKSKSADPG